MFSFDILVEYNLLNLCLICICILLLIEYISSIIFILLIFFLIFNCLLLFFFELELFAVFLLFLEIHVFYIIVCLLFTFKSIDDLEVQYLSVSQELFTGYFLSFFIIFIYIFLIIIADIHDDELSQLCFYIDFVVEDCFIFEYDELLEDIFEFFFFFYSFSFFLLNFFILFCFILFGVMQEFFQTSLVLADFFSIFDSSALVEDNFLVQYNECTQLFEKKYIIASFGSIQDAQKHNFLF